MKKLTTLLSAVFVLCLFSTPTDAQDFEGVIHYEVINEATTQGHNKMPYMIKGNKARMEMGQGKSRAAMLFHPEESKRYVVMPGMKGYMEMDPDQNGNDGETSEANVSRTGETKTIASKKCEVWQSDTKQGTFEACMAQGMGTFIMPTSKQQRSKAPAWAKEFIDKGAMPLEVTEIKNGTRTVQMKATKIEEKSLSDDLFEVPEGYRDVSNMRNQMRGMGQ